MSYLAQLTLGVIVMIGTTVIILGVRSGVSAVRRNRQ